MSPPKGYPTTRAGRAQRSREAAERRAQAAAPVVSDEAINAAAERVRITTDVPPPPGFGTAADLEPWRPSQAELERAREYGGIEEATAEALVADGELLELEGGWKLAQKIGRTLVRRMPGPFEVDTSEGTMRCENGWLAIDSAGNPYPIEAGVFGLSYVVSADAGRPELEHLAPGLAGKVRPA